MMHEDGAVLQACGQILRINAVFTMPFEIRELLAAVAAGLALDPAHLDK
jgi:hypothetical protein